MLCGWDISERPPFRARSRPQSARSARSVTSAPPAPAPPAAPRAPEIVAQKVQLQPAPAPAKAAFGVQQDPMMKADFQALLELVPSLVNRLDRYFKLAFEVAAPTVPGAVARRSMATSPTSPGTDPAREELHAQFAGLRRELVGLLDRKEEEIQQLIDKIPSHAAAVEAPPALNAAGSFSSLPPPQESARSDASMPEFLKPQDGMQERFSFENEAERTKFASKATSGRTFRQEKGLRKYIQKGTHLGLFVDSTGCRPILEKAISKVEYLQSLHEPPRSNCLAKMVDSSTFQFVCTVVILANCLTLLFSANWAMEHLSFDIPQSFRVLDLSFTSFYVIELLLKLIVHRQYFFWHQDWRWNVFDFVLVILAVQEQVLEYMASQNVTRISYMRSLRLVRVSRVLRLLRAIRVIRELRMMVFSIMSSLNALFWCLVLVSLVICVFSLFFLQISTDYLILEQENIAEDVFNDFQKYFGYHRGVRLAVCPGSHWSSTTRRHLGFPFLHCSFGSDGMGSKGQLGA
eukprot:s76_g34.t1